MHGKKYKEKFFVKKFWQQCFGLKYNWVNFVPMHGKNMY